MGIVLGFPQDSAVKFPYSDFFKIALKNAVDLGRSSLRAQNQLSRVFIDVKIALNKCLLCGFRRVFKSRARREIEVNACTKDRIGLRKLT